MQTLREIARSKPVRFEVPVVVFGSIKRVSHAADIDNRTKPVLDILKTAGIYKDDSIVTGIAFVWNMSATRLLIVPAQNRFEVIFHPYDDTGALGAWFYKNPEEEDEHGD